MSVLHNSILNALREVGEDGLPEARMAELGGLWWRKRVSEINRQPGFTISYRIEKGEQIHVLTLDAERTASTNCPPFAGLVRSGDDDAGLIPRASADGSLSNGQAGVERASGMGGDAPVPSSVAGSLNPEPDRLFPASRPHFDDAREAA